MDKFLNKKNNMKTYLIHFFQDNGCDYTIACGHKILMINAEHKIKAKFKAFKYVQENFSTDEVRISNCSIHEVLESEEIDVEKWYSTIDTEEKKKLKYEINEHDRLEYERLRKKFGNV